MTELALQDDLGGKATSSRLPLWKKEDRSYAPILRKASATVTIGMLRFSAASSA
jgi:hypothetical protein